MDHTARRSSAPDRSTTDAGRTDEDGTRLGRWWNSLLGASTTATRTHGTNGQAGAHTSAHDVTPAVGIDPFLDLDTDFDTDFDIELDRRPQRDRDTGRVPVVTAGGYGAAASSHADWDVDAWHAHGDEGDWDREWDVEPAPVRRGIDPLLARFGAVVAVVAVAVPLAVAFTSESDTSDQLRDVAAAATTDEVITSSTIAAQVAPSSSVDATNTTDTTSAAAAPVTAAGTSSSTSAASTTATPTAASAGSAQALDASAAEPTTTIDRCASEYELAEGDYWIRLADASGVRLSELLAANNATIETVLVPGRSICLPAGATMPGPPPTAPVNSGSTGTTAPTTAAPTTAPPTTAAPTTTSPPAPTTPPVTTPPVSAGDVEAIIRSVWPDDLEDKALAIAWRESNHQPTAQNYCCYGLFQIYWNVHRSWLDDIGVTSAEQLFDPATNARAAYALYQRAGGWGPWGG